MFVKQVTGTSGPTAGGARRGEKASDLETTYRVMRALHLLKEKPKDVAKLREFVAHVPEQGRRVRGDAGAPSTMSGVYYAAIISKWLDDMEK